MYKRFVSFFFFNVELPYSHIISTFLFYFRPYVFIYPKSLILPYFIPGIYSIMLFAGDVQASGNVIPNDNRHVLSGGPIRPHKER